MAQQTINIGAAPDDGTGDTLRVGGDKINDNFNELYTEDVALDGRVTTLEEAPGGVAALDDVGDVNAPTPAAGDVLTWDDTPGEWVAQALPGAGAFALDDATDVDLTGAADGDVLTRVAGVWESVAPSAGANPTESIIIAIGDETTAITTGTAKVTFRMPYAFTLSAVRASLTTASSSGVPTFDINEGGVSILSTKLTIDANEKTSATAAAGAVISDAALADDAEITIDIDVAGTGAAGAKIVLIGVRA